MNGQAVGLASLTETTTGRAILHYSFFIIIDQLLAKHGVDDGIDIADVGSAIAVDVGTGIGSLAQHHIDDDVDIADVDCTIVIDIAKEALTADVAIVNLGHRQVDIGATAQHRRGIGEVLGLLVVEETDVVVGERHGTVTVSGVVELQVEAARQAVAVVECDQYMVAR